MCPRGLQFYLIQDNKMSFVETGKNVEFSIWCARKEFLTQGKTLDCLSVVQEISFLHTRQFSECSICDNSVYLVYLN